MILLLLFTGCGGKKQIRDAQSLQQQFCAMDSCCMEGEVTCQYEQQERRYTLRCEWRPERSVVTVLAPEELAGITAVIQGEDLTLQYQGTSLGVGRLSALELSPAQCMPMLLQALRCGYITSIGEETLDGKACQYLTLDQTEGGGEKVNFAVWLYEKQPAAAEIRVGQQTLFQIRIAEYTQESAEGNPAL